MLRLPHRGVLQHPQHRSCRQRAGPQRALRPHPEHHQREDLPLPLVLVHVPLHGLHLLRLLQNLHHLLPTASVYADIQDGEREKITHTGDTESLDVCG